MDNFLTAASATPCGHRWSSPTTEYDIPILLSSIDTHGGLRPFQWLMLQQHHVPVLSFCTMHITRFGVSADITSDRGPQFTSNLWTVLWTLLGAQLHRTTANHPQANGVVELLHRQLKAALKAGLVGPAWMDELPLTCCHHLSGGSNAGMCEPVDGIKHYPVP